MLEHMWYNYYGALETELLQCRDEGREVPEELLRRIEELNVTESRTEEEYNAVNALLDELEALPAHPRFDEPDDYASIKALCTWDRAPAPRPKELEDRIYGAWLGRVAGCLLGKPVENWTRENIRKLAQADGNWPLSRYIRGDFHFPGDPFLTDEALRIRCFADHLKGFAPSDDDTNYTVLALDVMEKKGRAFTTLDVVEGWLRNFPLLYLCTAEQAAYRNWTDHVFPPRSAWLRNPYREWIGAQIRADFFGYVNPGDPVSAAEMAYRDACGTHVKNGIYGAMFAAAAIAQAAVTEEKMDVLAAGMGCIPHTSRLHRDLTDVKNWYEAGVSYWEAVENIHARYPQENLHNAVHTLPNAMIVAVGLLYGEGYGDSVSKSVMAAMDTDCNGATLGSIAGMMTGAKAMPRQWTEPLCDRLETNIVGFPLVSIADLAARTMKLMP